MPHQNQSNIAVSRGALSPLELATRWGKSRQHVYDCIARGELRSFTSGRSRLIPIADIERIERGDAS